jgi:hypothetical protein
MHHEAYLLGTLRFAPNRRHARGHTPYNAPRSNLFDRMTSADPNYNSHRAQRLRWRPHHAQHSLRTQKSVTALHGGLRKRLRSSGTLQDGLLGCNDKMMQHAPGYCGGLHEPSRPRESHTRDAAGTSAADGRWSVVP